MAERYNFKYLPLVGKLPGKSMVEQTETAINELASVVYDNVGHVGNLAEEVQTANTNASNALDKATEALETSSRVYIKQIAAVDVNDYYDSELYYIDNDGSTNVPVRDRGFLEVKTNDDKTACEQVFIADSTGTPYYRHGRITKQTLGEKTTYVVTWSSWYREQQADWNVTDTTSKAFIKNKPKNLINIGNNPKFDLVNFYKDNNNGFPNYFLMHELVQYNPDKLTLPISEVYGFNGMVFGDPRVGNGGSQFLAMVKVGLGYEPNTLYSSSTHYSPVVIKDETNNKYYWAMKINGSYQRVYMLGTFSAPPLKTAILSVDIDGNLPEGWSLVHTALPYPFDNTSVAIADKDRLGNVIDTTYAKKQEIASTYLPAVVGAVIAFAGSTSPAGWLLCDGSAVSRTDYAALFAVIGTTYGTGDGNSTFNLPNLVDKFVEGSATSGTVKSAGLPNITGGFKAYTFNTGNGNGAFNSNVDTPNVLRGSNDQGLNWNLYTFDASRSNSVYGNSNTVQPPALTMRYIIKY